MTQNAAQKESRSPAGTGKAAHEKSLQSQYSALGGKSQVRPAKELAAIMLWAMLEQVPVIGPQRRGQTEIEYGIIRDVLFSPANPTLSVRIRDVNGKWFMVAEAKEVTIPSDVPDPVPDVWERINITDARKEEIFEAMRNAYTVRYFNEEFRRIHSMKFSVNQSDRADVYLELVNLNTKNYDEEYRVIPQELAKITGHQLNRERGA